MRYFLQIICCIIGFNVCAIDLLNIQHTVIEGNKSQVTVEFSKPPLIGKEFIMHDPKGVVFDFLDTHSLVKKEQLAELLTSDVIRKLNLVSYKKGTRLVVNLAKITKYNTAIDGNKLIITFDNIVREYSVNSLRKEKLANAIESIDFRRENSEGKLMLKVSNKDLNVNIKTIAKDKIVLDFQGVSVADHLVRIYDVRDFASPVQQVQVKRKVNNIAIEIMLDGTYEYASYQLDNQYVFAVKYADLGTQQSGSSKIPNFTGEKISLNFQNIAVRSVLQILANFTDMNMVTTDEVQGNITLRLNNIPWDQALDFILKSKGLGQKRSGNILLIAPQDSLTKQEESENTSNDRMDNMRPLITELVPVNYAKAGEISGILKSKDNSLLSSRGQITVDERTNTLLVKDTEKNVAAMRSMLQRLDVPVKQVLIEAQIVSANMNWNEYFGMAMYSAAKARIGKNPIGISDSRAKAGTIMDKYSITRSEMGKLFSGGNSAPTASGGAAGGAAGGAVGGAALEPIIGGLFGISIGKLPGGTLLDLELSALESEARTHNIARPRVITQDQQAATISSGKQIPYQSQAGGAAGGTTTIFKDVNTNLNITPQVTPNNKILLKISLNQDSPEKNTFVVGGDPIVSTQKVDTQLLLDNGETAILGGVFTNSYGFDKTKIPVISEIPLLGRLFRQEKETEVKTEISFFITPRILSNGEK